MYEYHKETEELTFVATICDDVVWDSYISEEFGEKLLFTASHNDKILDIYLWDTVKQRFVPFLQIPSDAPNSRMGGAIFKYKESHYYPAQNCSQTYGGAIDIKRIDVKDNRFMFTTIKHIASPCREYELGLHTLNEYKGMVVIDVKGYRYGRIGAYLDKISMIKKILLK